MRGQLEHLAKTAQRPNVNIQVLPLNAGAQPSMGCPFNIVSFTEPLVQDKRAPHATSNRLSEERSSRVRARRFDP